MFRKILLIFSIIAAAKACLNRCRDDHPRPCRPNAASFYCDRKITLPQLLDSVNISELSTLSIWYANITEVTTDTFMLLHSVLSESSSYVNLDLRLNGIQYFHARAALPVQNVTIRYLNLERNSLSVVHRGMFIGLESLSRCVLKYNNILSVESDAFYDLPDLCGLSLGLSRNASLSNKSFPYFDDYHVCSRFSVFISSWDIKVLQRASMFPLRKVAIITIYSNSITHIEQDAFADSSQLEAFVISSNISVVPHGLFQHCPRLFFLSLPDNKLKRVTVNMFAGIGETLETLRLNRNEITQVELNSIVVFQPYGRLKTLEMNHNRLKSFSTELLLAVTSLTKLDISHNEIATLANTSFQMLKDLEILHLHNNKLTYLTRHLFVHNLKLRELSLQHNDLKMIDFIILGNTQVDVAFNDANIVVLRVLEPLTRLNKTSVSQTYLFDDNNERNQALANECSLEYIDTTVHVKVTVSSVHETAIYGYQPLRSLSNRTNCSRFFSSGISEMLGVNVTGNCFCSDYNGEDGLPVLKLVAAATLNPSIRPNTSTPAYETSSQAMSQRTHQQPSVTATESLTSQRTTSTIRSISISRNPITASTETPQAEITTEAAPSDDSYNFLVAPLSGVISVLVIAIIVLLALFHPKSALRACRKNDTSAATSDNPLDSVDSIPETQDRVSRSAERSNVNFNDIRRPSLDGYEVPVEPMVQQGQTMQMAQISEECSAYEDVAADAVDVITTPSETQRESSVKRDYEAIDPREISRTSLNARNTPDNLYLDLYEVMN